MPKNYNLYLKGYVGDWYFSADMVNAVLDKYKDKKVCVLIDNPSLFPLSLSYMGMFIATMSA